MNVDQYDFVDQFDFVDQYDFADRHDFADPQDFLTRNTDHTYLNNNDCINS
jgi:hypothetical protein